VELGHHGVERARERADLVAPVDVEPAREVTGAVGDLAEQPDHLTERTEPLGQERRRDERDGDQDRRGHADQPDERAIDQPDGATEVAGEHEPGVHRRPRRPQRIERDREGGAVTLERGDRRRFAGRRLG